MITSQSLQIPQISVRAPNANLCALVDEIAEGMKKQPLVQLNFDGAHQGWQFIFQDYATPDGMMSADRILSKELQKRGLMADICSMQSANYPGKLAVYAQKRGYVAKTWEIDALLQRTTSRVPEYMSAESAPEEVLSYS